jgi:hypothetical protein
MTLEEFEKFVEKDGIEWAEDNDHFYFRDRNLNWYAKDTKNALRIGKDRMKDLSLIDLEAELSRGLKVEHITRVTGYFAKVNSWNPGKRGELHDRHKVEI